MSELASSSSKQSSPANAADERSEEVS